MTEAFTSELAVAQRRRRVGDDRRSASPSRTTASRPRMRAKAEFGNSRTSLWKRLIPLTFGTACVGALWIGWLNREGGGVTPESGVGYWLGIAGSSLMLLLLLYPLRKRMQSLRVIGTVGFWFRAHMMLGAVSCVLILWHANFSLGSINSNMALLAMLVVAASGVVGLYLYSKIRRDLYGRRAAVRDVRADAGTLAKIIDAELKVRDQTVAELNAFARLGATAPKGVLAGLVLLPAISLRGSVVRMHLIADARRVIAVEGKRLGWPRKVRRRKLAGAAHLVTLHVAAVKKAATFALYERLFRIWHVFHMPLFFLLVVAIVIHVYAAHFF
jgi:hypothetical protein